MTFRMLWRYVGSPMSIQIVISRMETDLHSTTCPLQSSQYSCAHESTASLPRDQIAGSDIYIRPGKVYFQDGVVPQSSQRQAGAYESIW